MVSVGQETGKQRIVNENYCKKKHGLSILTRGGLWHKVGIKALLWSLHRAMAAALSK
jgi:hypothetical protein